MLIRSVLIYLLILFVIRLMGKRQVGEMQPFEFVITLIVADLACIPMSEVSVPLLHGVVPMLALLVVHFFICVLSRKSMKIRYLISGRPAIVVTPSGIDYEELKKLNMTLDDLIEAMRGCDVFAIDEIAYAIIETNGKMCIIPKAMNMPVTRKDMDISGETSTLPINIIMDGKLMQENVELSGIDEKFIESCLMRANANRVKDVLLFSIDNSGKVFIQAKNSSEYLTFDTDFAGDERW
ncbi:MAG: DUF421 domain-containing protein [Clostridia bacterium]|nr:DUF421 domain-containing protein [Clostridia bacterium]